MKKVIKLLILALLFVCNISCKKNLTKVDYEFYVQDKNNGLRKKTMVGAWEYNFQYKPYDYILLCENIVSFEREKRLKELEGTAWFNISFMNKQSRESALRQGLNSKDEYDSRLNYFLNDAINSVQLHYGHTDTLKPIAYAFENNYNLSPQETIVVGFKLPDGEKVPSKDMQIVYEDKIFKNGIIKVIIDKKDLRKIPNLAF